MSDDVDRVAVRLIALLLREFAEQSVACGLGTSIDAEEQHAWTLLERGEIHLVAGQEEGSLGLAPTRTAVERFRLKRKHRRLVDLWRAMACEAVAHG